MSMNPNEPEIKPEIPDCPKFLTGEARREWHRVTRELHELGVIGRADRMMLSNYCESWAIWREACEEIKRDGVTVIGREGHLIAHPASVRREAASREMLKFAQEYGMTASARTRVSVAPKTPEKDSLEKLIDANREAFIG